MIIPRSRDTCNSCSYTSFPDIAKWRICPLGKSCVWRSPSSKSLSSHLSSDHCDFEASKSWHNLADILFSYILLIYSRLCNHLYIERNFPTIFLQFLVDDWLPFHVPFEIFEPALKIYRGKTTLETTLRNSHFTLRLYIYFSSVQLPIKNHS